MVLLHSCCGPCSAAVLPEFNCKDVIVYFYNPSIYPEAEYKRRLDAQVQVCNAFGVELLVPEYDHTQFSDCISKYKKCSEQGSRCTFCFFDRFVNTANAAKSLGIDTISSTLSVSPYKDSAQVIGQLSRAADIVGVGFLDRDFKGCVSSLPFKIYEQDFCGCEYSNPAKPIQKCTYICSTCLNVQK